MSELTLTLIKLGFLLLLWIFAFAIASAIRSDLFGVRPRPAPAAKPTPTPAAATPPPAPAPPKPVKLNRGAPTSMVVVEGPDAGRQLGLTRALTMGRGDDNDLALTDEYASTRHARLVPHDGQWYVEDLGSTNGTYVAGARIARPTPVGTKSTIRIGRTVVELRK
jgi:pSer/pThr/pTyr-binding forkhead associated (FHA) protein